LKEDIKVQIFLRTANKDSISQMQQYIASKAFAKNVEYIDKEKAKQIWNKDNNEEWAKILDANPFPESIDFPMDIKAIINGLISAIIAIVLFYGILSWIEN
jgi:cell division transport system permease protein